MIVRLLHKEYVLMKRTRTAVFWIMGILLVISVLILGVWQSYLEEIIFNCSCIYMPLVLPILISCIGIKKDIDKNIIKKIMIFSIIAVIYEVCAVPFMVYKFLQLYFSLVFKYVFGIIFLEFVSLRLLIAIMREVYLENKKLEMQITKSKKEA